MFSNCHTISKLRRRWRMSPWITSKTLVYMHVYIRHMYIAVYLRYHVSLLVNINIFYMTPQRATWKNSYYMLNVLPSLNKVLLLLLLLLLFQLLWLLRRVLDVSGGVGVLCWIAVWTHCKCSMETPLNLVIVSKSVIRSMRSVTRSRFIDQRTSWETISNVPWHIPVRDAY